MKRLIFGILAIIILVACSPSEVAVQTAIAETETAKPTMTQTPTITPTPTLIPTLTPTITPTNTPKPTPTEISCDADQFSAYIDSLIPVADRLSEKLQFIGDNPQVLMSMSEALTFQIELFLVYLDASELEPPPCAQMGHDKYLEAIQILLDTMDLVMDGDYNGAEEKLGEFQPAIEESSRLIQEAATMVY